MEQHPSTLDRGDLRPHNRGVFKLVGGNKIRAIGFIELCNNDFNGDWWVDSPPLGVMKPLNIKREL